jgi:excisionase family DNA binding protein
MSTSHLLSARDVADRLGVSERYVFILLARGELPSIKLGKLRRIPAAALDRFVEERLAAGGGTP